MFAFPLTYVMHNNKKKKKTLRNAYEYIILNRLLETTIELYFALLLAYIIKQLQLKMVDMI